MTDIGPALVYRLTCLATGKFYFGVTRKTLAERWKGHVKEAVAKRFETVLYRAIRKYGPENFSIEVVYEAVNAHEAQMCERALIAAYGSLAPLGLNTSTGGESHAGRSVTPDVRKKIADAKRGKKLPPEAVAKSAAARVGLKRSEETKAKHRETMSRPDIHAKCIAALNRSRTSETGKAARAAGVKKLWQNEEYRAQHAKRLAVLNERKRANQKPKAPRRTKHEAMIARWANPSYRENISFVLSKMSANPERRHRLSERNKKRGFSQSTLSVRTMVKELPCTYVSRGVL
jgi:group I intron endonuclease